MDAKIIINVLYALWFYSMIKLVVRSIFQVIIKHREEKGKESNFDKLVKELKKQKNDNK